MDEGEIRDSEWFQFFEDDSPWDEYKWEAFMRVEDERTNQFLKKFEKSIDLPDCEELIDRELNGDYVEEQENDCPHNGINCNECPDREECDPFGEEDEFDADEDDAITADYHKDPLWKQAYDASLRLTHLSGLICKTAAGKDPFFDLLLNSRMIAAKIAGGFCIGFHLDGLGGNIANHKKAFSAVLKCLGALAELEQTKLLTRNRCTRYRRMFMNLRERLMTRINELRQLFHKMREES